MKEPCHILVRNNYKEERAGNLDPRDTEWVLVRHSNWSVDGVLLFTTIVIGACETGILEQPRVTYA